MRCSLWPSIFLLSTFLDASQRCLAARIELPRRSAAEPLPNLFARALDNSTSILDYLSGGYYINITLNGAPFTVMIDTGSSDLWVAGTVPNAQDTGASAAITYAVGSNSGPVKTAQMTILGYTVQNQAFIQESPTSQSPAGTGLIGLGPSAGSRIFSALGKTSAGDPPLDRIFRQNTSIPNFITVLLDRPNDNDQFTGQMTISEVLPDLQNISSQTKVPVSILETSLAGDQHFSVLLDSDGIIAPSGQAITIKSNASYAPTHDEHQLQVVLDTGFSLPQFPEYVVDAIYSGISGARKESIASMHGDVWVLDCKAEVNVSIKIGGQTLPIHPLDLSREGTDNSGNQICYGTFQAIIPGAQDPTFDGVLGMTFLSNTYALLNYGDFIDGGASNTADPYVQLISTTNAATAHAEFVAARLGGTDTTGSQHVTNSSNSGSSSGSSSKGFFQKYRNAIIAAASVGAIALISAIAWLATRRRKPTYRPLFEPAPVGDVRMQHVAGYNTGVPYADPWTQRR